MLGAIIGDIVGSIYEFNNIKTTDFPLFSPGCNFTDDTIMTVATADAILHDKDFATTYQEWGKRYPFPMGGYGGNFSIWLRSAKPQPYNSFGNGAAMRVGPTGWAFNSLKEVQREAQRSARCSHNHTEGLKGAMATASAIYLSRTGTPKQEIKQYIERNFGYDLSRTTDEIRPIYKFNESCQGTVPEALICFLEGENFEHAIRLAISLGGDSDTLTAITGSIAEAYHGIPDNIVETTLAYLPGEMRDIVHEFNKKYNDEKKRVRHIPLL